MGTLHESGRAQVRPSRVTGPDAPADPLLAGIRQLVGLDYEVCGEIGRSADGGVAYLARDLRTRMLVAFKAIPGRGEEYELELVAELREDVPALEQFCGHCGGRIRAWGRFCGHCGKEIHPDTGRYTPEQLREAVQASLQDRFEILGDMGSQDGRVYFARNLDSGQIETLRLTAGKGDEFSIRVTRVLESLVSGPAAPPVAAVPSPPARPAPAGPKVPPSAGPLPRPAPPMKPASAPRSPIVPPGGGTPTRPLGRMDQWKAMAEEAMQQPLVVMGVVLGAIAILLILLALLT